MTEQRLRDVENTLIKHDLLLQGLARDTKSISDSVERLEKSVSRFADHMTGRKAIFGFVVGVGAVVSFFVAFGVSVIKLFQGVGG